MPTIGARASRGGEEERNPFVVLGRFHQAIASLTVVTGAIFLLALMVLLADERREVVGTLRLIGLTRARVLAQVILEGALIAGAGAALGVGLAAVTESAFNAFFQWRYDTSLVFVRITPSIAWRSIAVALPLGMAAMAGLYALVNYGTLVDVLKYAVFVFALVFIAMRRLLRWRKRRCPHLDLAGAPASRLPGDSISKRKAPAAGMASTRRT